MPHEQFATVEEQLRATLQQTGLSHHELARRSGVSQPVLSRFIRRERTLTLPVVNKLCDMLGLHLCRDGETVTPAATPEPAAEPTPPRGRPRKQAQEAPEGQANDQASKSKPASKGRGKGKT